MIQNIEIKFGALTYAASNWSSLTTFTVSRGRYQAGKNGLRTFVIALAFWSLLMAGLLLRVAK